jgi:hypothetical protein
MPFDPNYPFVPGDPSQWWRTRALPRIIVQPNAPPNAASGNPAGSDGIDDWFVPGQAPSPTDLPNDWILPGTAGTDASYPDDWIYPDNQNAPTPAPGPQPAATPAIPNRPAPPPDPFAAYWSLIPASRVGALAWAPPIFPNSFGQFPSTTPAPPPLSVPRFPIGGLLGGIPKMLAAQAAANDPWANGILGGIPKMVAVSASPLSAAGSRGILGGLANLQSAPSDAQADASYLPGSRPFLPLDPIGYQGGDPSYAYLRNDLRSRAGPTGLAPDQSPTDETFDVAPDTGQENATPNVLLVNGDEEEEKEHHKLDALVPGGLTEGVTTSPKALPTVQLPVPLFPRPSLPPTSAPQPSPRASLPPSHSPPPGGLSPASARPPANGPPAPAIGGSSPGPLGRGKQFEQQQGSQQTTIHATIDGRNVTVRLDFPPDKNGIVDLKDYNWSSPGYQVPFLQQVVIEDFQAQIRKYQAIHPPVKFRFSQQPPPWVERAIEDAGGSYFVQPP